MNDIIEKYRPVVMYNVEKFKNLKGCLYLDTDKYDMATNGIKVLQNVVEDGKTFIQCVTSHLTDFSTGSYEGSNGIKWWGILLIVLACVIALIVTLLLIRHIKRTRYEDKITSDLKSSSSIQQ